MANQNQYGAFLPTTFVWDVGSLYDLNVNSREFKELLVRLHEFVNLIALNVNVKDTGLYVLDEFVNGQTFFPNPQTSSQQPRQVYRSVYYCGPLPNATTKSIPHGLTINKGTTFTRIYGSASDTTALSYLPIPYVDLSGNDIQLDVDSTNINITTGIDYSSYDIVYIVLEYLKQ
jgi:hypothetical protein